MNRVTKTLITNTEDLKPGDVIYIFETRQKQMDQAKNRNWPDCNFHRICVVTRIHQIEDDGQWRYDHQEHNRLSSTNGDHEIINQLLKDQKILTNGAFGCNSRVDQHRETWRLDCIQDHRPAVYKLPNLVGNPAYDLMM